MAYGGHGGELSRQSYADVVAPLLAEAMPRLGYAAGRLGSGSDVLGFDDAMSRDHDWGCRLTVLVDERDRDAVPQIIGLLERGLPESYRGYPVRFPVTWNPVDILASPARRSALQAAYRAWADLG